LVIEKSKGLKGNGNVAALEQAEDLLIYRVQEILQTEPPPRCNMDMVDLESVWNPADVKQLKSMLQAHVRYTNSPRAKFILDNWEAHLPLFVKVMPIDYRKSLERMRLEDHRDKETVSATEEVYHV